MTADERQAARLTLEKAEEGWEWDFVPEPDGSVWIAPLVKGDNPDTMDRHAVRAVRSMLLPRPIERGQADVSVERFVRRR